MHKAFISFLGVVAVVLITISQTFFIVDQQEQALVLQLGQPVGKPGNPDSFIREPGLHVKIPIVQNVLYFDRRVLPVDPDPEQVVISSYQVSRTGQIPAPPPAPQKIDAVPEDATDTTKADDAADNTLENVSGEPIIVDTFARYKIIDPLQFLKTLRTPENATQSLKRILNDATSAELGRTTLQELLSPERTKIMAEIRERVNRKIEEDKLGIQIVDVRIVRADLTGDNRASTVRRMISELTKRATETRSKGEELALQIRSTADKERTVLLANAQRDAEIVKGEGDKEAIKIYASAFNKDKDFYSFVRSMEAYRNTLANPDTQLILSPDSKFFKYFQGVAKSPQ